MQKIPVTVGEETILIPTLRVQQIIDLATLQHDRERGLLIEDADEAGLSPEEKMKVLRDHRKERGLSATIVRSAFSVDGAHRIIRCALDGEYPAALETIDPTQITNIALGCLGVELEEVMPSAKGSAEGKEVATNATG
tara:strand:+ start:381 stop:794 length:414 start_codon:yes stop_codon:yes gene_type:complete